MRIALCDDDPFMRETIQALITRTGHEIAGIADTTVAALGLIEHGRPDAVILDLLLGYGSDFDLIGSAIGVGARPIVFSRHTDAEVLHRYSTPPTVISRSDLGALEQLLLRLAQGDEPDVVIDLDQAAAEGDRRHHPPRVAQGPVPTGVGDAQAFFEAVNEAQPGDGMLSLDLPLTADANLLAEGVARYLRATDRVLAFQRAVRVYLPGGGEEAVRSLMDRIVGADSLIEAKALSIVVAAGEEGPEAFDRLKHSGAR